jgi:hypothetical protein
MPKKIKKNVQVEKSWNVHTSCRVPTSQRLLPTAAFQKVHTGWLPSTFAANAEIKFYVLERDGLGVVSANTTTVLNQWQTYFENK